MGIDYGTKRIGIALSDPLRILATAYATLTHGPDLWQKLRECVQSEHVEFVVLGLPLSLSGAEGQKADEVRAFAGRLKEELSLEVVFWDERFTTSLAHQYRLASGVSKKERRRKDVIDSAAAAIMLQGFLDSTKKSLNC